MKKELQSVNFALRKINTEQFAILQDNYEEQSDIRFGTKLHFAADQKARLIAVFAGFIFELKGKPFLVIEVSCNFEIVQKAWKEMLNNEKDAISVPKCFMSHLAMLTVGTARGVLHAKTEGTCFNQYFIPPVNVVKLIKEDTVFKFQQD